MENLDLILAYLQIRKVKTQTIHGDFVPFSEIEAVFQMLKEGAFQEYLEKLAYLSPKDYAHLLKS